MPNRPTPKSFAIRIKKLINERHRHQQAIDQIDDIISEVTAALGSTSAEAPRAANGPAAGRSTRRRKRGSFAVTGDQSIINFVKSKGKPTGRDIEMHWKSEGRGGFAANALSKLVKKRVLKREPIKDGRGSKYSIA